MGQDKKQVNIERRAKAFEWMKLISVTGSVQILVQAISFASGILVVRLLSEDEYAYYTMANTLLGTMVILADGGISNGVMALGAKAFNDPARLGAVLKTGFALRKRFAIGSMLIATPILLYLLRDNGISWLMSIVLLLSLIPAFYTSLATNLLEIIAKVRQDILPLQRIRVETNVGRLALICIIIFVFPYAYLAILASGIPQVYNNWRLRKNAQKYVDFDQEEDPEIRKDILKVVKRILPGAFYFSISGQITIWLISIFGDGTKSIAQLGGLDRLSMVLSIFTALFVTLVTPRYARLPDNKGLLFNRFIQIQLMMFALSTAIVFGVWLFADQALWLLGPKYNNLQTELVFNIFGNCLGMVAGATYSLFTNRGWNLHPAFSIPMNIALISIGIAVFPIGTVMGVLKLNIFINTINLIVNSTYLILKVRTLKIQNT